MNDQRKKLLSSDEISEPGLYWWLPLYAATEYKDQAYWVVISWHPQNPQRQKSGYFYGPLNPPLLSPSGDDE